MNSFLRASLLSLVLVVSWTPASRAQTADTVGTDTPPPGSTVITSDVLHADQINHTSLFTGNVLVVGTNFNMTCDEMNVIFTKDGKVEHIIATGNVIINQPGRVTRSGHAEYFAEDDKFILTDQPSIVDNKNQISAPKITIYRTNQTMVTEGKPCKVVLINGGGVGGNSNSDSGAPAPLPNDK